MPVFLTAGSDAPLTNPGFFGSLLHAAESSDTLDRQTVAERRGKVQLLDAYAAAVLADRCTPLRHPNDIVLLAVADLHAA